MCMSIVWVAGLVVCRTLCLLQPNSLTFCSSQWIPKAGAPETDTTFSPPGREILLWKKSVLMEKRNSMFTHTLTHNWIVENNSQILILCWSRIQCMESQTKVAYVYMRKLVSCRRKTIYSYYLFISISLSHYWLLLSCVWHIIHRKIHSSNFNSQQFNSEKHLLENVRSKRVIMMSIKENQFRTVTSKLCSFPLRNEFMGAFNIIIHLSLSNALNHHRRRRSRKYTLTSS